MDWPRRRRRPARNLRSVHSTDRAGRRLRAIDYWLPSLSLGDVIILNSNTPTPTYHLIVPFGFMTISEIDYLRIRCDDNPFQAAEQMAWFRPLAVAA